MKLIILVISVSLLMLISCDCEIKVVGKVLEKDSGKPIQGAVVDLLKGADIEKTNSKGIFEVIKITGFCKDPMINISSTRYKPFQIVIKKSKGQATYSIKTETKWIDFNKPYYPDPKNANTYITGTWINRWSENFTIADTLIVYLSKEDSTQNITK